MNWLLDTDVLSQPAKKNGDPRVIAWLREEKDRCHTSAVVIATGNEKDFRRPGLKVFNPFKESKELPPASSAQIS